MEYIVMAAVINQALQDEMDERQEYFNALRIVTRNAVAEGIARVFR